MKRKSYLLPTLGLVIIIGIILAISFKHGESQDQNPTNLEKTRWLMDTAVTIRASGSEIESVIDLAFSEMERVEAVFSRHLTESMISQINQQSGNWVTVSNEVIELVSKAIGYSEASDGAFDITVGTLIDLWDFTDESSQIPTQSEIDHALKFVGYTGIEINRQESQIRIPAGMVLDLGGIAKGYAIDGAKKILEQHQVTSAMIFAGGDITTIGVKADGSPWRVGIQHPRSSNDLIAILELVDSTIVTSGDYERFFIRNGVRYHHLFNPKTGLPASDVISVTVYGGAASDADALSTAIFIIGKDAGMDLVENTDFEAVIVDTAGEISVSSGLTDLITVL